MVRARADHFLRQGRGRRAITGRHTQLWRRSGLYRYNTLHGMAIAIPASRDVAGAIRHFQQVRGVLQVSRNQVHHLH